MSDIQMWPSAQRCRPSKSPPSQRDQSSGLITFSSLVTFSSAATELPYLAQHVVWQLIPKCKRCFCRRRRRLLLSCVGGWRCRPCCCWRPRRPQQLRGRQWRHLATSCPGGRSLRLLLHLVCHLRRRHLRRRLVCHRRLALVARQAGAALPLAIFLGFVPPACLPRDFSSQKFVKCPGKNADFASVMGGGEFSTYSFEPAV